MKQNFLSLIKGIAFSSLTFTALFFFLAFLMFRNNWGTSLMFPILSVAFCLSVFLGSFFFTGKAPARKFLWGLWFGAAFFLVFLTALLLLNGFSSVSLDRIFTYLAFALISGMAGGMLRQ